MSNLKDFKNKNTEFSGTTGIDLPEGTTAQRVNTTGTLRFNSDTGLSEYYTGTVWKVVDNPPTVALISPKIISDFDGSTLTDITVTGTNFQTGLTVKFIGADDTEYTPAVTTRNSDTEVVVRQNASMTAANSPYDIVITNSSGLSVTFANQLAVDTTPTFSLAADTNIGTVTNGQTNFTSLTSILANDADGDTITYSVTAGSIPTGMSLNTTGTFAGTVSGQGVSTEYTFTVQASTEPVSGTTITATRQYKMNGVSSLFIEATGGTVTEDGDYKVHTFTGDGCLVVSNAGDPAGSTTLDYLVVAGGGGGNADNSGGGGGGGVRFSCATFTNAGPSSPRAGTAVTASATTYPITVGGGGTGPSAASSVGKGSDSIFSTITSAGGGLGSPCSAPAHAPFSPGGSGGGSGQGVPSAGNGNTPPVSPPQGSNGGSGASNPGGGGGGGGFMGGGGNQSGNNGGGGGAGGGFPTAFGSNGQPCGSSRYYGGGGGGGTGQTGSGSGGSGGLGGGGAGGPNSNAGTAGTGNTGGGAGGGGQGGPGANGGSGIVVIRYKFQ